MGHQWRFRKTDLDRWVEDGRRAGGNGFTQTADAARRRQVLVADDEQSVRDTLSSILTMSDCDIDLAADGLEAALRLREREYDIVITDLQMPRLDGMGVAAEAKRLWPEIKVIIVTGYPSQSSAIDAVNLGVDGYITKPFRPVDVLIALARASGLGNPRDERLPR